jgi:cell shape-determining protein MreC
MTQIKPTTLFAGLMFLAFITAFFIPHRVSDRGRAHVQALFAPVAVPTRFFAGVIHDKVWPTRARDEVSPDAPRAVAEVYAENDKLRVELANVVGQLEHFRTIASELEDMGPAANRSSRYTVMGGDTAGRDSLKIVGRSGRLQPGMPALTRAGLIGKVASTGTGSATIQLLTDRESRFSARVSRYADTADGFRPRSTMPATLVQGAGKGLMKASMIEFAAVEKGAIQVGDWMVLDDESWPTIMKNYRVGKVKSIERSRDNMLLAEVIIEPLVDPLQLRDVMVVDK